MAHGTLSTDIMRTRFIALVLASAIVLLGVAVHLTRQQATRARLYANLGEKMLYLPSGKFLKQASFGMDAAIASLLWVRTVIYFGTHYTTDKDYRWLAHALDVTTTLDPSFSKAYRVGGLLLSMEANHIDDAITLLDKGIRNNPNDWKLYAAQGFNYFYFKEDKEKAAECFEQAARLPDTPDHIQRLAARMYAQMGKTDMAMEYLETLAEEAQDESVRQALADRYRELIVEKHKGWLESLVERYEQMFQERPQSLADLVSAGLIAELPPEPFGGEYIIHPETGRVQSTRENPKWP